MTTDRDDREPEPDPRLDRRARRTDPTAWSKSSRHGVVAGAHYLAADAGGEILAAGGTAADAAVATALALNVCEPAASGLGGMAMALVLAPGASAPTAYHGPCRAPRAATPAALATVDRYRGFRAVAVPGAAAAWSALLRDHGQLPLQRIVAPAVRLARTGYPLSPLQHRLATTYRKPLREGASADHWLDAAAQAHPIGTPIRQPELADTLARLGSAGLMDFYHGDVARQIAADMQARGGFVGLEDLAAMREPAATPPLSVPFGAASLHTVGPPAGGLALAQLARLASALERLPDPDDPEDLERIVELIRRVRRDRRRYRLRVGSSDLGEAAELLDEHHVAAALREIDRHLRPGGETSHVCVMDAKGMTVSMTASIERSFGAAVATPALGFLYNGYLRGFKVKNRRHPHFLSAGAPARSNAAPTIVVAPDGTTTAIGCTGSERMTSSIFTALLRLLHGSAFEAVAAPRLHATPDGEVLAEIGRFSPACRAALARHGTLVPADDWAFTFGGMQLARRDGDQMTGVAEPRRDGGVAVGRDFLGPEQPTTG